MDPTLTGTLQVPEGSVYWKYEQDRTASSAPRPTLVLVHAAVADHTLWDDQVATLVGKGWKCLRFDLLGFGQSRASDEYLRQDPRPPVDHLSYVDALVDQVVGADSLIVPIGLSFGGYLAVDYAVSRRSRVAGLAVTAGGLSGFDKPNTAKEIELFEQEATFLKAGDIQGLADLYVQIWANGPLQAAGRVSSKVAQKLYDWCFLIAKWECAGTGGSVLGFSKLDPPAAEQLDELQDLPVAVAYGEYDETETTAAMKYLGDKASGADVKGFESAHMINLEFPEEYNEWLVQWLSQNFVKNGSTS